MIGTGVTLHWMAMVQDFLKLLTVGQGQMPYFTSQIEC